MFLKLDVGSYCKLRSAALAHRCFWVTKEAVPHVAGAVLLSLTQENAVDLHSVDNNPLTLATMVGETLDLVKKKESLSLHESLATDRHISDVSFTSSLKSNLLTGLTTQNPAENNCFVSNANTSVFEPNTFLTRIY